jgi:hypothetical protein
MVVPVVAVIRGVAEVAQDVVDRLFLEPFPGLDHGLGVTLKASRRAEAAADLTARMFPFEIHGLKIKSCGVAATT